MSWIKRKMLLNTTLFFIILLFSIKIFDVAFGLINGPSVTGPTNRSLLLYEHPPNSNILVQPSDAAVQGTTLIKKPYLFRTDENGFIVGPKDFANKREEVSIIFLGGSTTECLYVDEDKRFPYLVSEKLTVRVLNGGVSGNHSMHSLMSLIGKGIPYKPKHIILLHGINDLGILYKTLSYWDAPRGRALVQIGNSETSSNSAIFDVSRSIKNFFIPNIWPKIRYNFQGVVDSVQGLNDEWVDYRDKKYLYNDVENILVEQFTASLKSFVRVSRSWGIEPILMTQFNRIKSEESDVKSAFNNVPQSISYDEFVKLVLKSNDVIREVSQDEKVLLIDLDVLIPPTKNYINDSVHLNTNGSELAAKIITDALKKKYPSIYH